MSSHTNNETNKEQPDDKKEETTNRNEKGSLICHPYLEQKYSLQQQQHSNHSLTMKLRPRRSSQNHQSKFTFAHVMKMEMAVIAQLKEIAQWRLYRRGPQSCYASCRQSDRTVDLRLTDLTVYALLDVLDRYMMGGTNRDNNNANDEDDENDDENEEDGNQQQEPGQGNNNNNDNNDRTALALPEEPGPWTMPDDIAILDQLKNLELFHCTGILPRSMNYLTKLRVLKLRSCHHLDLSQLHYNLNDTGPMGLQNLTELEITDSEALLPRSFRYLPNLQKIKMYRIQASDADTNNIGKEWIQDFVSMSTTSLAWSATLRELSFCSAGLSNDDLALLLVEIIPRVLPNLRSLYVISNPDITSFKELMNMFQMKYRRSNELLSVPAIATNISQLSDPTTIPTPTMNKTLFVPPVLRVLSLTGNKIPSTVQELQYVSEFIRTYTEIGLFMLFSISRALVSKEEIVKQIDSINHAITVNRAGGHILFSCEAKDDAENEGKNDQSDYADLEQDATRQKQHDGQQQQPQQQPPNRRRNRRPLPISMWPFVLERAANLDYMACVESPQDDDAQIQNHLASRHFRAIRRGRALIHRVNAMQAAAAAADEDNGDDEIFDDEIDDANDNEDVNEDIANIYSDRAMPIFLQGEEAYTNRAKYDAIYYLLRNGPVLFATGESKPRSRRRRSYIPRKCKRCKIF